MPSIFDDQHPSNAWLKRIAPISVPVLLVLVIFMQQFLVSLSNATTSTALHSITSKEDVTDPGVASLTINAKLMIKLRQELIDEGAIFDSQGDAHDSIDYLDSIALNRVDRMRVAIVAAEFLGPSAALVRLDALKSEVQTGSGLAADIDWLERWYKSKAAQAASSLATAPATATATATKPAHKPNPAPTIAPVTPEAIDAIIDRHGWFGQLAFSLGKPASDELRWDAVSGGDRLFTFFGLINIANLLLVLAGFLILVPWVIAAARGALDFRLEPPSAPAQIYYETFSLYSLIFTFAVMLSVALLGETSTLGLVINEMLVWACATVVLWPRLRGVPRMEFADDMGLNRGEGFLREIGVGIGGFIACFPLSWLVGLAAHALFADQGDAQAPGGAPMYETPLPNSWALVLLSASLSIIWAPFVEECLFRGTLHTALRSRMGRAAAIILSSLAFGATHPYDLQGIVQVSIMGISFALVREWRGSLIAPIVMHALHNGFLELEQVGTIALAN